MRISIVWVVLSAIVVLRLLWWRRFVRRNVPRHPPLTLAEDDPAMMAAVAKARGSLVRFRELRNAGVKESQVKVPFTTDAGSCEHLWAEVLALGEESVTVRYLTPPVSHKGKLERVHTHPIADIEDWAAFMPDATIHGGYTQRVMFDRAREQWGRLPKELERQSSRYVG